MVNKKNKIQKVLKAIRKGSGRISKKASKFKIPKLKKQPKRKKSKKVRVSKSIDVGSVLDDRIARRKERGI